MSDEIFESTVVQAHRMAEQAGEVFKTESMYKDVAKVDTLPEPKKEPIMNEPVKVPEACNPVPVLDADIVDGKEVVKDEKLEKMKLLLQRGLQDISEQVEKNKEVMKQAETQLKQVHNNITALMAQKSLIEQLLVNLNE